MIHVMPVVIAGRKRKPPRALYRAQFPKQFLALGFKTDEIRRLLHIEE